MKKIRRGKFGTLNQAMTRATGLDKTGRDNLTAELDRLLAEKNNYPKGSPERTKIESRIMDLMRG
jgi:hypothetical protein